MLLPAIENTAEVHILLTIIQGLAATIGDLLGFLNLLIRKEM